MSLREQLKSELSYACIFTSSMSVDWDKLRGEDSDGVEIVLPKITISVLEEYDRAPEFDEEDWLEDNIGDHVDDARLSEIGVLHDLDPEDVIDWLAEEDRWRHHLTADEVADIQEALAEAKADFFDPDDEDSPLFDAIEQFKDSQEFYEWKDRYEPMMNFIWPVDLGYGVEPEEAAALIDQFAGSTTLVYIQDLDTHAIALSGGGMDLSWDIATAYLCCGCLPPVSLLYRLPRMCETYRERHHILLTECSAKAADFLRSRADNLLAESASTRLWFFDNRNLGRNFRTEDGYLLSWSKTEHVWTDGDLSFPPGIYGEPADAEGQPPTGAWEPVPAPSAG